MCSVVLPFPVLLQPRLFLLPARLPRSPSPRPPSCFSFWLRRSINRDRRRRKRASRAEEVLVREDDSCRPSNPDRSSAQLVQLLQPAREMLVSWPAMLASVCEHAPNWRVNVRWRYYTRSVKRKEAGDLLFSESGDQSKSNRSVLLRMTIRLSVRITASLRKGEIQVPRVADMYSTARVRAGWRRTAAHEELSAPRVFPLISS